MQYITTLTGLQFFAYHGLYPEEQQLGQNFTVDMQVSMQIDQPISHIEEAINYELLHRIATEEMANRADLIETVAQRMIHRLKQTFTNTTRIAVTIHKPNPAGMFKSGVASVTMIHDA